MWFVIVGGNPSRRIFPPIAFFNVVTGGEVGKEVGGVFKIDWKRKTF
jgi:hypothetical protein